MKILGRDYPQGVWSLLEMLEIKAKAFALASDYISQIGSWKPTANVKTGAPNAPVQTADDFFGAAFAEFREQLQILELKCSIISLDRVIEVLKKDKLILSELTPRVDELRLRFYDELQATNFLILDSRYKSLYEQKETIFGVTVEKAFSASLDDLSEGAKCLALSRYTASVFHFMRATEAAIQQVAHKIGATVKDAGDKSLAWGVIAANVKIVVDKMPKGSNAQIEWYRVHALLESLNRAWRVPTAHPKQTYTEEEATAVLGAVKSFMSQLAPLA